MTARLERDLILHDDDAGAEDRGLAKDEASLGTPGD